MMSLPNQIMAQGVVNWANTLGTGTLLLFQAVEMPEVRSLETPRMIIKLNLLFSETGCKEFVLISLTQGWMVLPLTSPSKRTYASKQMSFYAFFVCLWHLLVQWTTALALPRAFFVHPCSALISLEWPEPGHIELEDLAM